MTDLTICVIPVTGPVQTRSFAGTGFDEIVAALGTNEVDKTMIDATEDWGVYAWVGDHSLYDGSPINQRATEVRDGVRHKHGHEPHPDPLCGTVALMAFDRHSGESIDLPKRWQSAAGGTE